MNPYEIWLANRVWKEYQRLQNTAAWIQKCDAEMLAKARATTLRSDRSGVLANQERGAAYERDALQGSGASD